MKNKIIILNVMTYEKKNIKGGIDEVNTRIEFLFADREQLQDSKKYLGYSVIPTYHKGNLLKNITSDMILVPLEAEFKEITDYNNPLASRKLLKSITYKGNVINLL